MLKYKKGYIFNGHTFVVNKEDVHNATDDMFVDATAWLPEDVVKVALGDNCVIEGNCFAESHLGSQGLRIRSAAQGNGKKVIAMLKIRPCHIREAKDYVKEHHRHNIPPVGGKFAVACYDEDRLCGVAICGRPVARHSDNGTTLEILRCCTDGTYNACSKLYGSCCRIGFDMGYERIITYTLESENGASLRASGFRFDGKAGGKQWTGTRRRSYYISPEELKSRWVKERRC